MHEDPTMEEEECQTLVSASRLARTFRFHEVYDGQPMHPNDVWPGGPNMIVCIDSLAMLTEIQMKISLSQLRTCAEGHLGFIKQ
jgi:hypothetical protein